jgi:hypothetical protein
MASAPGSFGGLECEFQPCIESIKVGKGVQLELCWYQDCILGAGRKVVGPYNAETIPREGKLELFAKAVKLSPVSSSEELIQEARVTVVEKKENERPVAYQASNPQAISGV